MYALGGFLGRCWKLLDWSEPREESVAGVLTAVLDGVSSSLPPPSESPPGDLRGTMVIAR